MIFTHFVRTPNESRSGVPSPKSTPHESNATQRFERSEMGDNLLQCNSICRRTNGNASLFIWKMNGMRSHEFGPHEIFALSFPYPFAGVAGFNFSREEMWQRFPVSAAPTFNSNNKISYCHMFARNGSLVVSIFGDRNSILQMKPEWNCFCSFFWFFLSPQGHSRVFAKTLIRMAEPLI